MGERLRRSGRRRVHRLQAGPVRGAQTISGRAGRHPGRESEEALPAGGMKEEGMALKTRALILKNETFEDLHEQQNWDYNQMTAHRGRAKNWISFDSLTYNPADDCVYCGITDFSNDIFYRYRRAEDKFECLNFQSV